MLCSSASSWVLWKEASRLLTPSSRLWYLELLYSRRVTHFSGFAVVYEERAGFPASSLVLWGKIIVLSSLVQ